MGKSTRERLMAYPKEVIVDYFLESTLLSEVDFRNLEFRKCQARTARLLEEWKQIEDHQKKLDLRNPKDRPEWWKASNRLSQIMDEINRLSDKTSSLLITPDSDAAA